MTAAVPPTDSRDALPVPPPAPRTPMWTYLGSVVAAAVSGVLVLLRITSGVRGAGRVVPGVSPADLARGATIVLVGGLVFVVLYALVKLALLRSTHRGSRAALITITVLTGLEIVWFLFGIASVGGRFADGWMTGLATVLQVGGLVAAVVAVVLFFRAGPARPRG